MARFKRSGRAASPRHMAAGSGREGFAVRRRFGARGGRVSLPVLVACAVVLVLAVAGGAFAWYTHQVSRQNTFQAANLVPEVVETFDGTTKSNVSVRANGSSTSVYIRAQVAIGWATADGSEAFFDVPVLGTDYTMTWESAVHDRGSVSAEQLADGCWVKGSDGFYYWSLPVGGGKATGQLIDTCTWKSAGSTADGRRFSVDIAAQALQADTDPAGAAFKDAWSAGSGLTVSSDGILAVS